MDAIEHANGLLAMARKDCDALRGMLDQPLFADEIFGFHAQQAVEKTLKAWLASRGVEYPLTHDLSRLLSLLEDQGIDVTRYWCLVELNVFAVQARYDAFVMEGDEPLDRHDLLSKVEQLLEIVLQMRSDPKRR